MLIVRYGIGGAMVFAGIVMLIISPSGLGPEGFGMAVAAASPCCCSTSSIGSG
jgi:hypothetical protein